MSAVGPETSVDELPLLVQQIGLYSMMNDWLLVFLTASVSFRVGTPNMTH